MAMFVKPSVLVVCMGQFARQIEDDAAFHTRKGLNAAQLAALIDSAAARLADHKGQSDNADITAKEMKIQLKTTRIETQQIFSNVIEMVAGSHGKSTPKGRQTLKFRSRVIKTNKNRCRKRKPSLAQGKPDKK